MTVEELRNLIDEMLNANKLSLSSTVKFLAETTVIEDEEIEVYAEVKDNTLVITKY